MSDLPSTVTAAPSCTTCEGLTASRCHLTRSKPRVYADVPSQVAFQLQLSPAKPSSGTWPIAPTTT
jgi:hypothetical protein